jgi:hypothetical protein
MGVPLCLPERHFCPRPRLLDLTVACRQLLHLSLRLLPQFESAALHGREKRE